jgi:hypothetical protein
MLSKWLALNLDHSAATLRRWNLLTLHDSLYGLTEEPRILSSL